MSRGVQLYDICIFASRIKIVFKYLSEQIIYLTYLVRRLTPSILLQVFSKEVDKDMVVLMAARASRLENQDAIDAAIVSMLADPKEVVHLAN